MTRSKKTPEMTIKPKISVILFVKNDEDTCQMAIESILKQTLQDIEIIAIKQDSCDTTFAKCAGYIETDTRLSLISRQNPSFANLLKLINGDYVLISDTRATFQESDFENMYYKAEATKADFVFSNYLLPDKKEAINSYSDLSKSVFSWKSIPDKILTLSPYLFANKLYKTEFFQDLLKTAKECNILDESDFPAFAFVKANNIAYAQKAMMSCLKPEVIRGSRNWKWSVVSLLGMEFFLNQKTNYSLTEQSFLNYTLEKLLFLTEASAPYQGMAKIISSRKPLHISTF